MLGDRALGAVEIAPRDGFYDYANKYTRGATDYYVPPRVSPERYRGAARPRRCAPTWRSAAAARPGST